jgi:hypothetical protein
MTKRYLSIIRAAENQGEPPAGFMEAIDELVKRTLEDGTIVSTGGLAPIAMAARVRIHGNRLVVTDGPFAESKEVIGGYAVLSANSREDAIRATREFMQLHIDRWPGWVGECELRELVFLAP